MNSAGPKRSSDQLYLQVAVVDQADERAWEGRLGAQGRGRDSRKVWVRAVKGPLLRAEGPFTFVAGQPRYTVAAGF